jgi:N-acetylglutamate synthase-like GNAT family acetyltransferase
MTVIRQAQSSDYGAIHELAKLLYGPNVAPARAVRQDSRTFVARTGGEVKGFLIATLADYGFSMSGHLEELAVAEEGQGAGVGRALVSACEEWLKSEGVESVFVSALETAEGFYERVGYERCTGPWLFHRLTSGGATTRFVTKDL